MHLTYFLRNARIPPMNAAIAPISLIGIRTKSIAYVSLGLCGGSAREYANQPNIAKLSDSSNIPLTNRFI